LFYGVLIFVYGFGIMATLLAENAEDGNDIAYMIGIPFFLLFHAAFMFGTSIHRSMRNSTKRMVYDFDAGVSLFGCS
jgi:hypothetical protein